MEELRRAIGLRSYGQKDPLVEYKGEAFKYFEELMDNVRLQICTGLFRSASNIQSFENMLSMLSRGAKTQGPENAPPIGGAAPAALPHGQAGGAAATPGGSGSNIKLPMPKPTPVKAMPKVGRNEPCPCGSGKKFKQCHGK